FMADRRMRIRTRRSGIGRILAAIPVDVIDMLSLCVVGLKVVIRDRPRGRYAAVMTHFAEVFTTEPKQRGAVKLGISADIVIRMRMKLASVAIVPNLFGVVFRLEIHRRGAPVIFLAGNVVASLEDENLFSGRGELRGESPASGARADDDHVVMAHESSPYSQLKMQRWLFS